MTNPDRTELVKLDEAGLEAAVRECARITAPDISDDEYERIKDDNSPRYQKTREEMAQTIRAYLRTIKPAVSTIVTCCITGAIPGDGGACGDCDPCLLGEASVPSPVKRLIAEKNSLLHRIGELEDELGSLRSLASSDGGVEGEPEPVAWPSDGSCVRCGAVPRTASGLCNTCLDEDAERYENAQPADAGMREAFVRVLASLAAAISILERTPKAKKAVASDKMFDTMLDDYRKALEIGRAALTAPGATTKSDGGFLSPLPSGEGELAVTQVWPPSDPSSTRSDVTVDELAAFLDPGAFSGSATDRHRHCSPWLVETVQDRARDKARALLDQFEIRRK